MVHKVLFIVLLFVIGVMAVSCARRLVGSPIKEENITKIVVGKTTRAEILRLFGSPYRVESSDNKEIMTYLYGQELRGTVILYTEVRQEADILTVYIDRSGIVSDYSFSKGVAAPDLYRQPLTPQ